MEFPYGRAPFWILAAAILSGLGVLSLHPRGEEGRPDLVFALFADVHEDAYRPLVEEFERRHAVTVQMQLINYRGLRSRLQSALLVGAEVPDLAEILIGSMGVFTKGPLEDVGFVDLTERIHAEGLDDKIVQTRFSPWTSRGRILALPDDIIEAGRIDGCSEFHIYLHIVMPLVRPMSAAFCLVAFLGSWNSFIAPNVFLCTRAKLTLPVILHLYVGQYAQQYGAFLAGTLLAIVPPAILFFALQREFISGLTSGALKA